jgi:hypothetical protein
VLVLVLVLVLVSVSASLRLRYRRRGVQDAKGVCKKDPPNDMVGPNGPSPPQAAKTTGGPSSRPAVRCCTGSAVVSPLPAVGRQCDARHTVELRHPRGHQTIREAVKTLVKLQTNRS